MCVLHSYLSDMFKESFCLPRRGILLAWAEGIHRPLVRDEKLC